MRRAALAAAVLISAGAWPAWGQVSPRGLLTPEAARRIGLERMWFTQIDLDRGRGRVVDVYHHVSSIRVQAIYEFVWEGRRQVFSERDLNPFGEAIGPEGAQRKAEQALADLKEQLMYDGKDATKLPPIEARVVPDVTLYAATESGMIHAIDGETGVTRWAVPIGSPRHPTTAAGANEHFVAALNGSTLYVLRAEDGKVAWERRVVGAPSAGPAITDQYIYCPMINGAVETYQLDEPKAAAAVYRSFGRPLTQPVVSARSIAWTTDRGNLYVGQGTQLGMRFRFQTNDAVTCAPSYVQPDKIVVGSLDGYVYCCGEAKGDLHWKFSTGEPINHTPIGIGDTVYAFTSGASLFAIDAASGQEKWWTSGPKGFLAASADRLYGYDSAGDIVVLDTRGGALVGKIAAGGLDLRLANTQTDRIFIGAGTGLLQAFREVRNPWPLSHTNQEPAKKPQVKQVEEAAPGDAPAGGKPAPADPFDPFAPAKPAAPMPAPMSEPDPFAPPAAKPATPAEPDPFGM